MVELIAALGLSVFFGGGAGALFAKVFVGRWQQPVQYHWWVLGGTAVVFVFQLLASLGRTTSN